MLLWPCRHKAAQANEGGGQGLSRMRQQQPLPPPPHMRGRRDRGPPPAVAVAVGAASMARPPEQEARERAEGRVARESPVAARTRAPQEAPYCAAEEPAARDAAVAARTRPREEDARPYRAAEGWETREAPAATGLSLPGLYHPAWSRTARDAPAGVPGWPVPYPYYAAEPRPRPGPYPYYVPERPLRVRRTSALASCLVAAVFLLLAGGGPAAALFLLFRPRPPDIAVSAVRLPTFAAGNGTVAFTFQQMATVRNPNRSPLAHFDSSLRVAYAGGVVGSVYIPAGLIDGGRSKYMSASFAVPAFPAVTPSPVELTAQQQQQPAATAMVMEVDSLLVVKGKVKVLWVLTHRVQGSKVCRVAVSPVDGRVLAFRC